MSKERAKATSEEWRRARRMALENLEEITSEDDAEITENALADPDASPSDGLFRKRGRPFAETTKQKVSLRLDPDVVAHFRATGPGWQARMNDALRRAAGLKKTG